MKKPKPLSASSLIRRHRAQPCTKSAMPNADERRARLLARIKEVEDRNGGPGGGPYREVQDLSDGPENLTRAILTVKLEPVQPIIKKTRKRKGISVVFTHDELNRIGALLPLRGFSRGSLICQLAMDAIRFNQVGPKIPLPLPWRSVPVLVTISDRELLKEAAGWESLPIFIRRATLGRLDHPSICEWVGELCLSEEAPVPPEPVEEPQPFLADLQRETAQAPVREPLALSLAPPPKVPKKVPWRAILTFIKEFL